MSVPAELKYTAEHEWVSIEGETATIGITDLRLADVQQPNIAQTFSSAIRASACRANVRSSEAPSITTG